MKKNGVYFVNVLKKKILEISTSNKKKSYEVSPLIFFEIHHF